MTRVFIFVCMAIVCGTSLWPMSTAVAQTNIAEERRGLTPLAQTRLTNLAANISNQQDALYRRLTNVTSRLESRIEKQKALGYEVSAAEAKLGEAKNALDDARDRLAMIDNEVARFVGSENPREAWRGLKTSYQTIQTSLRTAHKAAVETLLLLKTTSLPETSSTAETATSSETIVE